MKLNFPSKSLPNSTPSTMRHNEPGMNYLREQDGKRKRMCLLNYGNHGVHCRNSIWHRFLPILKSKTIFAAIYRIYGLVHYMLIPQKCGKMHRISQIHYQDIDEYQNVTEIHIKLLFSLPSRWV